MDKITTISVDIETDKLAEFYISLALYKLNPQKGPGAVQKIADAIHCDISGLFSKFQLSEEKRKQQEKSLLEIHAYLYNSKKGAPGYLEVSKNTAEEFKVSRFGKELENKFYLMELSRQWTGKPDSMEVAIFIALLMYSGNLFAGAINQAIEEGGQEEKKMEVVFRRGDKQERHILPFTTDKAIEEGTGEISFYMEKDGEVIKVAEEDISEDTSQVFIMRGEEVCKMEKQREFSEYTPYYNVKVIGNRLDFSYAKAGEPYTAQIETISSVTKQEIKVDPYTVNIDSRQFLQMLEEYKRFLNLPKNKREETAARDEVITDLYETLQEHYPEIGLHVSTTITGYIASRMGLLDNEPLYDETEERKQPYRKYLRDTVYNILRSHDIIKK